MNRRRPRGRYCAPRLQKGAAAGYAASPPWDGSEGVWVISTKDRSAVLPSAAPPSTAIPFIHRLASSGAFKDLFREGMTLVEEAAAYLDGPGRAESRALPRPAALAYSTESMRLTTRLMQVASWLLLQRAVNEGELTSSAGPSRTRARQAFPRGVWLQARAFRTIAAHPAQPQSALAAHSGAGDAS